MIFTHRDKEWIGKLQVFRRKILNLNKQGRNICRASVLRIMDDLLPESDPDYKRIPDDYEGTIRGFKNINGKRLKNGYTKR